METILQTRLIGTFLGYGSGRVYRLADGSLWRQEDRRDEPCYREEPACRLLKDSTARVYLDVQGTSGVVAVVPGDHRWSGVGAF
jgi:hypothetical protein